MLRHGGGHRAGDHALAHAALAADHADQMTDVGILILSHLGGSAMLAARGAVMAARGLLLGLTGGTRGVAAGGAVVIAVIGVGVVRRTAGTRHNKKLLYQEF